MVMNKPAPTYFEQLAVYDNEKYFDKVIDIEWRGQLQSSSGNKKFKIKYYGELMEEHGLITATENAPALVYAIDIITGEEILLFDGGKHGYDAMFCDTWPADQISERPLAHWYTDKNGEDTFDIILSVYYNIDYEEEAAEFLNENGQVTLVSGEEISLETLKRNGFDAIGIYAVNTAGEIIPVVEEELG